MATPQWCDAVFEGGGVKGLGFVGAITATEARGYRFHNIAGTSTGAIVAALLAAGYTAQALLKTIGSLDYRKFKDRHITNYIPILGNVLSLVTTKGMYRGQYIHDWMEARLAERGVRVFGDLLCTDCGHPKELGCGVGKYRYKLQVVAADISRGKMLVLPQDIVDYGIDPDTLSVAHAVRMSTAIPFFYEPVIQHCASTPCYIVDGGLLSNFPIELFDDGTPDPPWPTFGYLLDEDDPPHRPIYGPVSLFIAVFTTMLGAHDRRKLTRPSVQARTIHIPSLGVKTTDFDLKPKRAHELYRSGLNAGFLFFRNWNFQAYKIQHRGRGAL